MRVYHGSDVIVDHPIILRTDHKKDFGNGFYTTQSYVQAYKWMIHIVNY